MIHNIERTTTRSAAVDTAEAKSWLRVDHDIEDDIIDNAVLAVQDLLEPPDGWLGRALSEAGYKITIPRNELKRKIVIPVAPLISLDEFKYLATDGTEKDFDNDTYRLISSEPAVISLKRNKTWPTDIDATQQDAIRIEVTAGYNTDNPLPKAIRQWVLYQVSTIYDLRNPVVVGTSVMETPHVQNMINGWRIRL